MCRLFSNLVMAAVLAGLVPSPSRAYAAAVSGALGFERASGPRERVSQGGLGVLAVSGRRGEGFVQGVRYDDSFVGGGMSATVGAGVALAAPVFLRGQATGYWGDGGHRASRFLVGPQLRSLAGSTLALSYVRFADELSFRSHGFLGEASLPLAAAWTARASASLVSGRWLENADRREETGGQATLGLSWRAHRHLELSGDLGLARSRIVSAGLAPIAPADGLPLFADESTPAPPESTDDVVSPTVLLGLRVLFP